MKMRAARMYGYNEPWRLEEIPVPELGRDEVLIKVAATGMCRSDFQLVEGYFQAAAPIEFPITPGHEIAGHVAGRGAEVPASAGLSEGDLVVVNPGWGDGTCRQCHEGNEQMCTGTGGWPGFGPPGGFAEYVAVPHRQLIRVPAGDSQQPENFAPLTDAGLTPYRGVKKLSAAGKLGPGRTVVVAGIGGLGSYAVQYAKLLGAGATVVGFSRTDDKLEVARRNGADHTVNTRGKSAGQVQDELERLTGRRAVDAVLDCTGAKESIALDFAILGSEGAVVAVGLMGTQVEVPLNFIVGGELQFLGSFWGNYNDLTEVLALAAAGRIEHTVTAVRLDEINENLQALGRGDVVGRRVVVFD
ncbi:NAD(P)-dependent alcohol dehydrogenase [Micromonospora sp. ALFpr18c]|uniref:NAD(P)-dependent alcohol dehydrogenase n=1 Tax=unclassified Micromonospora TaxID=2617518 RepID=UPI00124B461C|nr:MULTISPECIES: NAD(P)-dependent alcohol dehydrogenase [unclassified Micromonospora]KAB1937683.1 NAD(P)-dependent alcohol dehydrogenase [Micromonospora sp. ALFpr18c]MDG4761495.1 NAD(P)-dependent alcohol dehydrogenase [Micromonospora sp. WMMD710]